MKYECRHCGNDEPCLFEHRDGVLPSCCPFSRNATPSWKKKTPDPHVVTEEPQADGSSTTLTVEDDEIVKLADKLLYEHSLEGSRKALRPVFRLIAAKIEGVQEHLDEHNSDFVSNNMDHEDLERKVEELERKHGWCDTLHTHPVKPKPQSKGGVARPDEGRARCKDEKGIEHDLIPGRSVYMPKGGGCERIFHHLDGNVYGYGVLSCRAGLSADLWYDKPSSIIWLRDLSFPPSSGDEGTFPGGDQ